MFISIMSSLIFIAIGKLILLGFATLFGFFLFFRAARRELISDSDIFDIMLITLLSGLVFGKIFDFLFFPGNYNVSLVNLVFITTYGGFSFVGAALGALFGVFIYLRKKKEKLWDIFDLAAPPIVFSIFLISVVNMFFKDRNLTFLQFRIPENIFYALFFLLLFWILKRLEKKKRHQGFISCFFLSGLGLSFFINYLTAADNVYLWGKVLYYPLVGILVCITTLIIWYVLSERKMVADIRALFALLLLFLFSSKRVVTSSDEAGKFAKHILLLPYFLVRSFLLASKFLGRELALGLSDFLTVFKTKR